MTPLLSGLLSKPGSRHVEIFSLHNTRSGGDHTVHKGNGTGVGMGPEIRDVIENQV